MPKRLVVAGKISSGHLGYKIDNRFGHTFICYSKDLPEWNPQDEPGKFPETDHDLIRKQRIEDEGADL